MKDPDGDEARSVFACRTSPQLLLEEGGEGEGEGEGGEEMARLPWRGQYGRAAAGCAHSQSRLGACARSDPTTAIISGGGGGALPPGVVLLCFASRKNPLEAVGGVAQNGQL
jgi:hypothetical protein